MSVFTVYLQNISGQIFLSFFAKVKVKRKDTWKDKNTGDLVGNHWVLWCRVAGRR